jgi:hypothetical protein
VTYDRFQLANVRAVCLCLGQKTLKTYTCHAEIEETQPSAGAVKPGRWGDATPLLRLRADRRWTLFIRLDWELKYHDIFTKYADGLVDAIYEGGPMFENDVELQDTRLLKHLVETVPFVTTLP